MRVKHINYNLWLKNNSPNEVIGQHYHGKILLETEQTIDNERNLTDAILKDNQIQEEYEFSETSDDKGLFKLKDETIGAKNSIYFFKGAVENNYVEFGTYKQNVSENDYGTLVRTGDPIIWRILRINKDKSITITSSIPVTRAISYCGAQSSPLSSNYMTSSIKREVDNWYNETFPKESVEDKLVLNSIFCNDTNYTEVLKRLDKENPEPTLECPQEENKIKAKAGMPTADEVVYAGGLFVIKKDESFPTFLYTERNFWMMTAAGNNNYGTRVSNGSYSQWQGSCSSGPGRIRPVITLSANTLIATNFLSEDAPGTVNNPYKVVVK